MKNIKTTKSSKFGKIRMVEIVASQVKDDFDILIEDLKEKKANHKKLKFDAKRLNSIYDWLVTLEELEMR